MRSRGGLRSYAELASRFRRGVDYEIVTSVVPGSTVAILAPHGGGIERGTSAIARSIAGAEHNLYLFEGRLPAGNYEQLHLTSHCFDEPECLDLVARCDHIVAVHGCNWAFPDPAVLVGGLDAPLKALLADALRARGLAVVLDGHPFPARRPDNICNRGRRRAGVQLELSGQLRGGPQEAALVAEVRCALAAAARDMGPVRQGA